jgi:small subunit ribosomal protein S27Ae
LENISSLTDMATVYVAPLAVGGGAKHKKKVYTTKKKLKHKHRKEKLATLRVVI